MLGTEETQVSLIIISPSVKLHYRNGESVTLKYVIDNHKSPDIYLITNEARFLYAPQLGQWSIHLDKVIIQDESFELPELEKLSGNQRLYGEVSFALNVYDPGAFRLYLSAGYLEAAGMEAISKQSRQSTEELERLFDNLQQVIRAEPVEVYVTVT